jgi:hypothetical protein
MPALARRLRLPISSLFAASLAAAAVTLGASRDARA